MEKFLQKKSIRIALIVVAALLIIGLVGGILASMGSKVPASSGTAAKTTVTSIASSSGTSSGSGSSSGSSSSSSGSGSSTAPTTYTVTYYMGSYSDGGSVPDPVTVEAGATIMAAFTPTPTRIGYSWSGWARNDGSSDVDFQMATPIIVNSDIDLYPVFIPILPQVVSYGSLDVNVDGEVDFCAYHDPDGYDRTDDCEFTGSGSDSFTFGDSDYYLYVTDANCSAVFSGTYEGTYYDNATITIQSGEDNTATGRYFLCDPYKGYSYWTFSSGDSGTISIVRVSSGH